MIKLSKKGSYALKAVLYVAKQESHSKTQIRNISLAENISVALLRRIVADLEKVGILETSVGRNGGITLGKKVYQISLFDILSAVGEELNISDCTKGKKVGQ